MRKAVNKPDLEPDPNPDTELYVDNEVMEKVSRRYAFGVTEQVLNTIHGPISEDRVALQYMPQIRELQILPEERIDPIGDNQHSPVKGIVHRYPDRALLKISNICAVYCRFCFRREMIGPGSDGLNMQERRAAIAYIRDNPSIQEVILTGGDPLILSARKIGETMGELQAIEHVQTLRIHSRIPVADPQRITGELCAALDCDKPVYIVIHINHSQEITPEVERSLKDLRKAGCILLSQSVLLKGVNDDADILEDLFRNLIRVGVKPYYLHHPDLAPGTSHFRLSIKQGQKIVKKLLGRLSGICQPHYMLDIPGGFGKVPINSDYLEESGNGCYTVKDYQGRKHVYPPKE